MAIKQSLLEAYRPQLNVAEAYVARNFNGKQITSNTELTTAVLLNNTAKYLNEAYSGFGAFTQATNTADLGRWKKFCLNLTNLAVPSLIANDLVIVHPMSSISGAVTYIKYVSKTNKGGVHQGDLFNSIFGLGEMTSARQDFTAETIIDTADADASYTTSLNVIKGGIIEKVANPDASGYEDVAKNYKTHDFKIVHADGTFGYWDADDIKTESIPAGTPLANANIKKGDKIIFKSEEFQMTHVPAQDIPAIGPEMASIPLVAKPRRIAVHYDQITAFQAKTDYGFSLDKQIAEQACGELAYEIDTEIVNMLYEGAKEEARAEDPVHHADGFTFHWSKTLPVGVSKYEHFRGFLEIVELAKAVVYNRTGKFQPNYMVVASDVLPVLSFIPDFKASRPSKINGPFKAGVLGTLDVYVSPAMHSGEWFVGLNGSDMMSSAGVYAPYMAIIPTQLLGTPDGGLHQGFSTYYAKALLNKSLLVSGKIDA